jgi:PEP-CTERM motif
MLFTARTGLESQGTESKDLLAVARFLRLYIDGRNQRGKFMLKRMFSRSAAALFLGFLSAVAQAAPIVSGSVWLVPSGVAQNATPANVPADPPDVTFLAPSDPLSFDSRNGVNDYNLLNFLLTGGAFNIVEHTAGALSNTTNDHLYQFLGQVSVTNGQNFGVLHDDGLTLIIGGLTVISAPGPTPPILTNAIYTGPTGTFDFELVYGECCGPPAALRVELPLVSQVPEPGTVLLFAAGLIGFGLARGRRAS